MFPIRSVVDALNANSRVRDLKNLRNEAVDRYFRSRGRGNGLAIAERLASDGVRSPCFSIAFNTPWVVDLLTAAWKRNVEGMTLVVLDNSSARKSRAMHRQICEARNVYYLPLPHNPEWSPNRSHGISMNWAYYNVVRPLAPTFFGFIDHDCFPVRPFDFARRLEGKSLYGQRLASGKRSDAWCLWAGFSFFRFGSLRDGRLDFKHQVELGLDTGGGNWTRLYSRIDPDLVAEPTNRVVHERPGETDVRLLLLDDAFAHLAGASYDDSLGRAHFRKVLSEHLWRRYLPGEDPVLQH